MEEKKVDKTLYIITIVFLIVIIVVLSGVVLYDKGIILNSKKTNSVKIENNSIDTNETKKDTIIKFDKEKSLNNEDIKKISSISISEPVSLHGISFSTNEDSRKKIDIQVRWDILKEQGFYTGNLSEYKEYQISFDNNIEEIYGANLDFDMYGLVYLFLLEDGSVGYLKFGDIIENEKFEVKKLENVDNIIKFVNISYSVDGDNEGRPPTTLLYKNDGSFYDLSKLLNLHQLEQ